MKYLVFVLGNIDIAANIIFWMAIIDHIASNGKRKYLVAIGVLLLFIMLWPSKELWAEILIK